MPIRSGIAGVVSEVAERIRSLVRLELELAALELREKVAKLGGGVAAFAAAAVLGLFALGFGLATVAVALALFLDTWLALLLVTAGLVLLAIVASLVGRSLVRRAGPPVPQRAIVEAKATTEVLKGNGGG